MPDFPTIPVVINGMVLSATTLNCYHRGLRYLLAQSHVPAAGVGVHAWGYPYGTAWATAYSGYAPLVSMSMHIEVGIVANAPNSDWHVTFELRNGAQGWIVIRDVGWNNGSYHWDEDFGFSGVTPTPDPNPALVLGKIYEFRVRVHGNSDAATSYCYVWVLSLRKAIAGWTAPISEWTEDAVSSAASFNIIRTDLHALRDWRTGYNAGVGTSDQVYTYVDANLWHTIASFVVRHKTGQTYLAGIDLGGYLGNSPDTSVVTWGIEAFYPAAPITTVAIWAGDYSHRVGGGLWNYPHVTPITYKADGSGFSIPDAVDGAYYKINYWLRFTTVGNTAQFRRTWLVSLPLQTAAGGWPVLTEWAEGDANVGKTRLAMTATALNMLNTGTETLRPELPVTSGAGGMVLLMHVHPWVTYQTTAVGEVSIYYGYLFAESMGLPKGQVGKAQSFDLSNLRGLAYGMRYYVAGNLAYAFESALPYTGG